MLYSFYCIGLHCEALLSIQLYVRVCAVCGELFGDLWVVSMTTAHGTCIILVERMETHDLGKFVYECKLYFHQF